MENIDFAELYGVENHDDGDNTDSTVNGEKEQESAEPAEETDSNEKSEEKDDENARYAAARRKAEKERDTAIADAQAAFKLAQDKLYLDLGLENPYTHTAIKNKAEYDEYIKMRSKTEEEDNYSAIGIEKDKMNALIKNLPEIENLKKEIADAKAMKAQIEKANFEAAKTRELTEIKTMIPEYDSIEKILASEHGDEFRGLVKNDNLNFLKAFKIAFADEIVEAKAKARATAKINGEKSKDHLKATNSTGDTGDAEPDDKTFELYRAMFPAMSDDEIRKNYNRVQSRYFGKKKG